MLLDENLNDISGEIVEYYEKKLKIQKVSLWLFSISLILLILGIGLMLYKWMEVTDENDYLWHKIQIEETELALEHSIGYWFINTPEEVNDSLLVDLLIANNAWYPDILLKQAKLESADYTSNVYNNANNLFGMKRVTKRQTTQLNKDYCSYGMYNNWCLSALDRILWDLYYFKDKIPTREEYLNAMSSYAEDTNYISKII